MKLKNKKYFFGLVLLGFSLASSSLASGPSFLRISPESGSYNVGDKFSVVISVDPAGQKIDTVRVKLTYPADLLEINNFTVSPSFTFQAGSSGFDNKAGNFSWGAGLAGGTSSSITFGTVNFTVLKTGEAQISINGDSMILSAGEDKFNGQAQLANFDLEPSQDIKLIQEASSVKQASAKGAQILESQDKTDVILNDNEVEKKIITTEKPKDLASSIFGILPFRSVAVLWLASLILAALIALYIILQIQSKKNKDKKRKSI